MQINTDKQWQYIKSNYDNVNMRVVVTRGCYRLTMGRFDTTKMQKAQPIIGIGEYWTTDATEKSIAIASSYSDIKAALRFHCGVAFEVPKPVNTK